MTRDSIIAAFKARGDVSNEVTTLGCQEIKRQLGAKSVVVTDRPCDYDHLRVEIDDEPFLFVRKELGL